MYHKTQGVPDEWAFDDRKKHIFGLANGVHKADRKFASYSRYREATTFPFAAESHVLCMLIAAQGDAEVVAECLSEYSTSPRNGNRHF